MILCRDGGGGEGTVRRGSVLKVVGVLCQRDQLAGNIAQLIGAVGHGVADIGAVAAGFIEGGIHQPVAGKLHQHKVQVCGILRYIADGVVIHFVKTNYIKGGTLVGVLLPNHNVVLMASVDFKIPLIISVNAHAL